MIQDEELNGYEKELEEAEENDDIKVNEVHLPDPVKLDNEDKINDYVSKGGELDAIDDVTKEAAKRLNLGLLAENIRVVLELKRQREKITALEKEIYPDGGSVNASKDLVDLYKSERAFYLQQLEFVRKYVLNNKAAIDDMNAAPNELLGMLSKLSGEKLTKLKNFITELTSESTVNDDDLLDEQ